MILFGDFLAQVAGFLGNVPVVGPWISLVLRRMGVNGGGGEELPV